MLPNNNLYNFGIGVDIEKNKRFFNLSLENDEVFLKKIFDDEELRYCFSKSNPSRHLAVRFTGKEAAIKALSSLNIDDMGYKDIIITNQSNGQPFLNILKHPNLVCQVSFSHNSTDSIAFVVISHDK